MPYTPILATLGYIFSPDQKRVLMVHRIGREGDQHSGKYNGLGGKLEANEDIVAGMKREILEESGLECVSMQLAGTVSWPGFGKNGEDWFGFLFRITEFAGQQFERSPEGPLVWVDIDKVESLNLWDGDRYFLPIVLDLAAKPFHAVMPYHDSKALSWTVSQLLA
jgi:8-oxo-dGTP diphosphatase